ncbi:hypothetical protein B0H21DRAFT_120473 [Amylocystis lapponica]|nr:hypothetical protein B0H21DRAFT_120473 [Amylocystis lapponica]
MSPVEPATPFTMSSITRKLASRKLRIAGRLLAYDILSATILVADAGSALFVDISLCLDPGKSLPWLREGKTTVIALGYLEERDNPLPLPVLPAHAPATEVDPHLVLCALLVTDSPDLDMELWNRAIEERERIETQFST